MESDEYNNTVTDNYNDLDHSMSADNEDCEQKDKISQI